MVTLKQHTARESNGRVVLIPQLKILSDGVHVGYVGTHRGAPICLITTISPDILNDIRNECAKIDNVTRKVCKPPQPSEMIDD